MTESQRSDESSLPERSAVCSHKSWRDEAALGQPPLASDSIAPRLLRKLSPHPPISLSAQVTRLAGYLSPRSPARAWTRWWRCLCLLISLNCVLSLCGTPSARKNLSGRRKTEWPAREAALDGVGQECQKPIHRGRYVSERERATETAPGRNIAREAKANITAVSLFSVFHSFLCRLGWLWSLTVSAPSLYFFAVGAWDWTNFQARARNDRARHRIDQSPHSGPLYPRALIIFHYCKRGWLHGGAIFCGCARVFLV